jgi:hypothetical protein
MIAVHINMLEEHSATMIPFFYGISICFKDHDGRLITDPIEKANSLNSYYVSVQLRM